MASNLAEGAAFKRRRVLPSLIPSHTLPDISNEAIIIGVCGVGAGFSAKCDGWFLSDYFAFNYLLKGRGHHQTWITASSEADFIAFIEEDPGHHQPGFLHGSPYNDRKIVFNRSLVEKQEFTPFTV